MFISIPLGVIVGVQGTKSLAGVRGVPAHYSLFAAAGGNEV